MRQALWLSATALACFYSHVVPFALLCFGALLVSLERDLRVTARRLAPLAPGKLLGIGYNS